MTLTRAGRRRVRQGVALALAAAVGFVVGSATRFYLGVATGWAVFVFAYCLWTWAVVWRLDSRQTEDHAREEDPGRWFGDLVLIGAAVASVVGVGFVLVAGPANDFVSALIGVACVLASWILVHTVYGVRYADLYFSAPKPPIDFGDEPPTYTDFAYLSFCLGMTYQISDTNLKTRQLRKVVLWHTLLSYFLGAVVLACTINLVSGLAG
jgi:uncharacterized membrane protein